jgi:hypothetical protein
MRKFLIIGGGIVALCIAFLAFTIGGAFFLTQGVADAGNTFMTALQENQMDDTYALFAQGLQDEVDLETFAGTFSDLGIESWSFSSRSVENNQGQLSGTAVIGGETFNIVLGFVNVDDNWLIDRFNFNPAS